MEQKYLNNLLEAGESEQIEFKETAFLKDNEEIAAQLASFANRKGGKILVGVRDDGTLEGKRIERDKAQLHLLNIAQDKVSPPAELLFQFLTMAAGDVLIIEVAKRKGIPHAAVKRLNHEIKDRCYYIRTSSGKRLVSDTVLKWLFEHSEDPRLEYSFYIRFQYFRDNLQMPIASDVAPTWYEQTPGGPYIFLRKLTEEDIGYILQDEAMRVQALFIELLPYMMLTSFSWKFGQSWLITIERKTGLMTYATVRRDVEKGIITPADISYPPDNSLVSQLSFNLKSVIDEWMKGITVPLGTKISIDFEHREGKGTTGSQVRLIHPDFFELKFSFYQSTWSVGPAPGHPLAYMIDRSAGPEDQLELQAKIASVGISSKFSAEFNFPETEGQLLEDYWLWGKTIMDIVENEWDWDVYIRGLPNQKLYSMGRDIKEILAILKQHRP